MIGAPNTTLAAVISQEVQTALRSGMRLEDIIATLFSAGEQLQNALPLVRAAIESRYAP
jgi:hypothetical protein